MFFRYGILVSQHCVDTPVYFEHTKISHFREMLPPLQEQMPAETISKIGQEKRIHIHYSCFLHLLILIGVFLLQSVDKHIYSIMSLNMTYM